MTEKVNVKHLLKTLFRLYLKGYGNKEVKVVDSVIGVPKDLQPKVWVIEEEDYICLTESWW